MWRRLGLAWNDDAGLGAVDAVAGTAARCLGWSSERTSQEKIAYMRSVKELGLIRPQRLDEDHTKGQDR